MIRRTAAVVATLLLLVSADARAQGAPPGCRTPTHRQFDFWVGEWTVPNTGQSVNAYDALTRRWGQDFVGSGGDVLHLRSGLKSGAMLLEGDGPALKPARTNAGSRGRGQTIRPLCLSKPVGP